MTDKDYNALYTLTVEGKLYTQYFADVTAAATKANVQPQNEEVSANLTNGRMWWKYGIKHWTGANSLAEIEGIFANGWPEGVRRIQKAFSEIEAGDIVPMNLRRTLVRGEYGDELDIHRVYAGQLDTAWSRRVRKHRAALSTITIACDQTMGYKLHADTLFWRAAAVLKLSDILTSVGYSVEIFSYNTVYNFAKGRPDTQLDQIVKVKSSDMPLDLSALASSVAFAGFKRIRILDHYNSLPFHTHLKYGTCDYSRVPPMLLGAILAGSQDIRCRDTAQWWLRQQLNELSNSQRRAA